MVALLVSIWNPTARAESECDFSTRYLKSLEATCATDGVCDDLPEARGNVAKYCGVIGRNQPHGKIKRKKVAKLATPDGPDDGASNSASSQAAEGPSSGGEKPESSAGDCGPYTYRFGNPDSFKQGTEPWADAMCGMSVPPMCNTFAGDNYGSFQTCRDALTTHPLGEGAYQNPKRLKGN